MARIWELPTDYTKLTRAQRVAAKLRNIDYHDALLRAAQKELARRQGGKR